MSKLVIPTFNWTTHKKLWIWLFENPNKYKHQWPGWKTYEEGYIPINYCEACSYATQEYTRVELRKNIFTREEIHKYFNTNNTCSLCPFGAHKEEKTCFELFEQWTYSLDSDLALKIAQLPIRADMRVKVK